MGKTPSAVAAVTIYRVLLNTDYEVTKDDVSRASEISMATLNKIDNIVKALLPK
jgi:transcription initiation factor TFIIIB Brf1 subunit/transcription initiation factor TFIIB